MSSSVAMEDYSGCKYDTESQEAFPESPNSLEVDVSEDEGPFFDIDFAVPFYCDGKDSSPCTDEDSEDENGEEFEFNFSISGSSNQSNRNQCMDSSPADKLFYKGQLLPLQVNPREEMVSKGEVDGVKGSLLSGNVNGIKTHFPALLKTATKLKISLFGLKKTAKVGMDLQTECGGGVDSPIQKQNKFFTVKFKVVDVPLVSLFTRDNSRGPKRDETKSEDVEGECKGNERDRKKAKEIVQKYVKMIKPLYVKISQKYNEKSRNADLEKCGVGNGVNNARVSGSERNQNQISLSGNLKTVYKHFGKGRNSQASNVKSALPNYYSESTMMELQSAIQGAIAHCKQSNSSDDAPNSSGSESSP